MGKASDDSSTNTQQAAAATAFSGQIDTSDLISEDIFKLVGLESMNEAEKQRLYGQFEETIRNRVIARLFDKLTDEQAEEFAKFAQSKDSAGMTNFLQSINIDLQLMMAQEAIIYKSELLLLCKPFKAMQPAQA